MKKKKPISKLIKELDLIFSYYIRLKNADLNGNCKCYTCGKKAFWKEMQNGHFISRAIKKFRYDENNCEVQCVGCNVFKNGNYIIYTQKKIDELGKEKVEEMSSLKTKLEIVKLDRSFYEKNIEKYKIENKRLKEEKNIQ